DTMISESKQGNTQGIPPAATMARGYRSERLSDRSENSAPLRSLQGVVRTSGLDFMANRLPETVHEWFSSPASLLPAATSVGRSAVVPRPIIQASLPAAGAPAPATDHNVSRARKISTPRRRDPHKLHTGRPRRS